MFVWHDSKMRKLTVGFAYQHDSNLWVSFAHFSYMGFDKIDLAVDVSSTNTASEREKERTSIYILKNSLWNYFIVHSNLVRMSFCQVLMEEEHRNNLCSGIAQSMHQIRLCDNVLGKLNDMLMHGTVVQKTYLIIFAIVRLNGLYEIVAEQSTPGEVRAMETLYDELRDHLTGEREHGTDAFAFVKEVVCRAAYLR